MIPTQYIWFVWTCILLAIWGLVYFLLDSKAKRREMLLVSAWSSLFGLTEPIFVPAYWNPPSLFDLAQRTGFDIESIIWTFALAGIVSVLYEFIFPTRLRAMSAMERSERRHRLHFWAVISGPATFFVLVILNFFNPIYSFFIAAAVGSVFTLYCRPDLARKMLVSAVLFTFFYALYFRILILLSSDYVQKVWNLKALSGVLIAGIPLEELLFAFGIGLLWSSIYELVRWKKLVRLQKQ